MRKINSIGYGAKITAAAGIFLIAVPLALLAISAVIPFRGLKTGVYISLAAGALIVLFGSVNSFVLSLGRYRSCQ
jgi:hypothetical protein